MSLYLVRHARPLIAPGLCYGQLDVAADVTATQSAALALAAHLPAELPSDLPVRVSPLQRCRQLAEALQALRPDLKCVVDGRLQEMSFGIWEGVAWSDIPPEAVSAWTDDFGAHRFGGAESANEVLERVAQAYDETLRDYPKSSQVRTQGEAASLNVPMSAVRGLWITHAGVIRAAHLVAQGIRHVDHAGQWPLEAPSYGQWLCL